MPFTYEYPRPALTVDDAIFAIRGGELSLLMIKRAHAPFKGAWALPGGFVDAHEPLEKAAARELEEETGVSGLSLVQLGAYGDPGRDPRGHTVSVAFLTFVGPGRAQPKAGDDAAAADWVPVARLIGAKGKKPPRLAFDHARIVRDALARLRFEVGRLGPECALEFVGETFSLGELQGVVEAVLGRAVDKRNFRSKLDALGRLVAVDARKVGRHRPAQLFRWSAPSQAAASEATEPRKPAKTVKKRPAKKRPAKKVATRAKPRG